MTIRSHRTPPFLRRRGQQAALAAMIGALLPGSVSAEAGRVTFAHGPATAVNRDGATRPLARGSEIDAGDTVRTGTGRVQLRFTDGAYVSLKPDTEFRVDEYQFKGSGESEERGFFSLLRGGLRTITGLIGRARQASYRMSTPVATIGIRGTEYNLDLLITAAGEPFLKWNVADDGVSSIALVLADGSERVFTWGGAGGATQAAFAQLAKALQQLAQEGRLESVTRDQIVEVFAAGDTVDGTGRAEQLVSFLLAAVEPPPPPPAVPPMAPVPPPVPPPDCSMPTCAMTVAFGAFNIDDGVNARSNAISDGGEGIQAVFDALTGGLLSHTRGDMNFNPIPDGAANTARVVVDGSAHFSVDPANPMDPRSRATWGRWIGPVAGDGQSTGTSFNVHPLLFRQRSDGASNTEDTFAFALSIPPAETFNQGIGLYAIDGFTPPGVFTPADPGAGAAALGPAGTVTGSLTADFEMQRMAVNVNVPFANGTYNLQAQGGALNMFSGLAVGTVGAPYYNGALAVTGSGVACRGDGCSGTGAGNVFGPGAGGATLGYRVNDDGLASDITGVLVSRQQSCVGCAVAR